MTICEWNASKKTATKPNMHQAYLFGVVFGVFGMCLAFFNIILNTTSAAAVAIVVVVKIFCWEKKNGFRRWICMRCYVFNAASAIQ